MDDWTAFTESSPLEGVMINEVYYRIGDRVKLRPRPGSDIFDLFLAGKTAVIEAIEQDFENKIYFAVVVEDDPGQDLGLMRQPGHRFFFFPDEVELLPRSDEASSSASSEASYEAEDD